MRTVVLHVLEAATGLSILLLLPVRWLREFLRPRELFSLWTGTPILTMPLKARAERLLGVKSRSLVFHTFYLTSEFDYNLSGWRSRKIIGPLVPFAVFVWVCLFVDRVHAYCDKGILPSAHRFVFNPFELWVYNRLSIEVLLWTYGADVRTRSRTIALGEPNCCTDCTLQLVACACDGEIQAANFTRLRRRVKAIFSMGDMTAYTPGSRNDLFYWPVDLDVDQGRKYAPAYPQSNPTGAIRILHSANHRMFKGTRFLEQAVDKLRAAGWPLELVLVENLPNDRALEVYRSADIVFDQCMIGFHGYFALEAMALGKPVMCFIRAPQEYLLSADECPIINTHVTTLCRDLERLLAHPEQLTELGRRGRAYVEKYYSIEAFSRRLNRAYRELRVKTCEC